ncbi:hypothetical protein, partial [Paenacidovorax caeni]|uniref:hypothetical protein n=1 Tax=Paenacidovorax caeni TaxID=343013 RepID=UPI001C312F68
QQARQQFFGYVVFLGAHGAYGQAGLRRRWIVRLHKILHTLATGGKGPDDNRTSASPGRGKHLESQV